jgi:hypothetical protein
MNEILARHAELLQAKPMSSRSCPMAGKLASPTSLHLFILVLESPALVIVTVSVMVHHFPVLVTAI